MARFKSISLRGVPPRFTLRFATGDPLFEIVERMSSEEVRGAMGAESLEELRAMAAAEGQTVHALVHERLADFAGKRADAYDGWPAGSAERNGEIRALVERTGAAAVLDPFGGRAAYPIAAGQAAGTRRLFFCEISRAMRFVADARVRLLMLREEARREIAAELDALARRLDRATAAAEPAEMLAAPLESGTAELLARVRSAIDGLTPDAAALASAAVVEGLLRGAPSSRLESLEAIRGELRRASAFAVHEAALGSMPVRIADDARDLARIRPLAIDCVVTHPPSLNFATYSNPAANWFLGFRRAIAARLLPPAAALQDLRTILGSRGADVTASIASAVRELSGVEERLARIAANYFRDMAAAFRSVEMHLTRRATFGLVVRASSVGGVSIDTPAHLAAMLETFGFRPSSAGSITVLER